MRGIPGERCGTSTGYREHTANRTKPCQPCKDAQAAWQREYRKRTYLNRGHLMVDATGTRRRLQALARLGWSFQAIGEELGITGTRVGYITRAGKVRLGTARKVSVLYDRWSMQDGGSAHARGRAIRAGWCLPLDWDDEVIDDPNALSYTQRKERHRNQQIVARRRERQAAA